MCERVIDYYDTANNPVYKIKCDCRTTICQHIGLESKEFRNLTNKIYETKRK